MKRYGDICAMKGAEIEPVDIVTFGAPCQDLSIAGKRKGMKHEANGDEETTRSGLFFEAIRVIKEMRAHERAIGRSGQSIRCRYAVYENVPGALSSNNGADWQAVLTEIVRIVQPEAPDVPLPDKGGWPTTGSFCGVGADGQPFSVAWRIHDAQFWGVPQRRRRVCVLADFAGLTAPWILFDPQFERASETGEPVKIERDPCDGRRSEISTFTESLSGNLEPRGTPGEGASSGTESGADCTICLQGNGIDRSDTAGCNGAGWRRGGVL